MDLIFSNRFEKQAKKIEKPTKVKLARLLSIFADNPYDSRLHSKPLSEPLSGIWSFRITRDWRVTFHFISSDTVRLLEVKHRKDIYR